MELTTNAAATRAPQNIWTDAEFTDWIGKIHKYESHRLDGLNLTTLEKSGLLSDMPNAIMRGIVEFIRPAGSA